jgi:hypothetical protein
MRIRFVLWWTKRHRDAAVRADQAWFWSERWQQMEREVDDDVARGEVRQFMGSDDFLTALNEFAGRT